MKEYTKPEIVVTAISNTEVIAKSGGLVTGGFTKTTNGFKEVSF